MIISLGCAPESSIITQRRAFRCNVLIQVSVEGGLQVRSSWGVLWICIAKAWRISYMCNINFNFMHRWKLALWIVQENAILCPTYVRRYVVIGWSHLLYTTLMVPACAWFFIALFFRNPGSNPVWSDLRMYVRNYLPPFQFGETILGVGGNCAFIIAHTMWLF